MTKQELMESYTAEQLADMVVKLQEQIEVLQEIATEKERKLKSNIISVVVGGISKEYQIEEVVDIIRAYEEIKICQELNKQCKTILPSEYLKVLTLNQTVSDLQSEVEKYRKVCEDAKKESDCRISEYQKKIDDLEQKLERQKIATKYAEEYVDSLKCSIDRKQDAINQIDSIICELFGIAHSGEIYSNDFKELLRGKSAVGKSVSDFLPTEPIKVADMLINAEGEYEHNPVVKKICGTDKGTYHIFDTSALRQIAEHLLIYCNHNKEVEE